MVELMVKTEVFRFGELDEKIQDKLVEECWISDEKCLIEDRMLEDERGLWRALDVLCEKWSYEGWSYYGRGLTFRVISDERLLVEKVMWSLESDSAVKMWLICRVAEVEADLESKLVDLFGEVAHRFGRELREKVEEHINRLWEEEMPGLSMEGHDMSIADGFNDCCFDSRGYLIGEYNERKSEYRINGCIYAVGYECRVAK